jgi:hypothetical protein
VSHHRVKPKQQTTRRIVLALLCVLLVIVCGTIQAVHVHPAGEISHADCALCATAHLAVQVVQPAVTLFVTPIVVVVETAAPRVRSTTFSTFALFTRPPPVDVASA